MKDMTRKSSLARIVATGALLTGALLAGQSAIACTIDNWSASTGAITAGDPVGGIARYQGLCGLQVTGTGYVQDNNPGGIDRIV
ncbi:MAG: hypothetical protein RQ741_07200, partial [Wenzhouxiangellaceae bacterium]|nr:hypothetical protein [Wenzhouxiangellaceae bacterium]